MQIRSGRIDGKPDIDTRSLRRLVIVSKPHAPSVIFDDPCDDRQAEADAGFARRHIGFKQSVAVFDGKPGSRVANDNLDLFKSARDLSPGAHAPSIASAAFLIRLVRA